MKLLTLAPGLLALVLCAGRPSITSPVSLADAVLTLPAPAVAGMSPEGRRAYLENPPGDHNEAERRIHYYADSSDAAGDPESMFFLRLFEDECGRTIAASHAARPFTDGREPKASDTLIHRAESGRWVDLTDAVLPADVDRSCWFRFHRTGETIPCGPYQLIEATGGRGTAYRFGEPKGALHWSNGRFAYQADGR